MISPGATGTQQQQQSESGHTWVAASSTTLGHNNNPCSEVKVQSQLPIHGRALSAASKRRSVSSMKSLLPLTLSPLSSSSSFSSVEESVGVQLDGYFPEVLAKDLERSSSVFSARNMTSGAPDPSIALREKSPSPAPTWPLRSSSSSQYRTSSCQFRPLGPIQERNSVVSFLDRRGSKYDDLATDQESVSGTELSRSAEAPSISFRDQSIGTAATSLTSSTWGGWSRNSPPCDRSREHSWIEMDSDDEHETDMADDGNFTNLSPRPPTPPESEASSSSNSSFEAQSPASTAYYTPSPGKAHSVAGMAPLSPLSRRRSVEKMDSSVDPMSMNQTDDGGDTTLPLSSHARAFTQRQRQRAATLQSSAPISPIASRTLSLPRSRLSYRTHTAKRHARICTEPYNGVAGLSASLIDDDDDDDDDDDLLEPRTPTELVTPTPPPASQFADIHAWINNGPRPYTSQGASEDVLKAVPLPPNVIETLRVSVACFPETMLLSSSLTIDTIRNYSRKVRQPCAELLLDNLAPDAPTSGGPKRSIWKRVVSYKRSPSISLSKHHHHRDVQLSPSAGGEAEAAARPQTAQSLMVPQRWGPLKNIFPYSSDYICDALWAHIVAYNYISAVAPRAHPKAGARGRPSVSNESQKDDVPKKAALLLGIGDPYETSPSIERLSKKVGAPLPIWSQGRDGMVADQPSSRSPGYDNAVRDVQAGLLRCILRLIATAKLMTEGGTGAERMVEGEPNNVDVMFTRSLFEIVRISEENAGRC